MGGEGWYEFQLRWKDGYRYNPDEDFAFKKTALVPLLDRLGVKYAFILDEPEYVLTRLEPESEGAKAEILAELKKAVQGSTPFSTVTVDRWVPEDDARKRIVEALGRLGQVIKIPEQFKGPGWWIRGDFPTNTVAGSLELGEQDIDQKIAEDAAFMAKVVGEFTLAYLRNMPRRIEDRC